MTGLPAEAADTLIVDTIFLVVSCMVTGEAEWFFRGDISQGEMVEFLEEGESVEAMEGVYKVGFLFVYEYMMESVVLMFLRRRFAWYARYRVRRGLPGWQ